MGADYKDFVKESLKLRPIAYYPIYTIITNNAASGILLSQLMYWFRTKSKVFKTKAELKSDVGMLSESMFRTAMDKIKKLPFLKVKHHRGIQKTHITFYRQAFREYIVDFIKNNPETAELFAYALVDHEDFESFYAQKIKDSEDSCVNFNEANVDFNEANVKINEANVKINEANVKINEANSEEIDTEIEEAYVKNNISHVKIDEANVKIDEANVKIDEANVKIDVPLYKDIKENKEVKNIIIVRKNVKPLPEGETPSSSSLHLPSEDKPQSGKRNIKYSTDFEFAWKLYKADSSLKGVKKKAFEAYNDAVDFHEDKEIIYDAIRRYRESSSFELRPAHMASFLHGICNPDHKYYLDYIKGGYEARLLELKAKNAIKAKDDFSEQETYRKDLSKQGELNPNELMERTSKLNMILKDKYGVKIGIFRFGKRHDWVQYTGPNYIALPIKHPMSKTEKIKVLFHIDELRNNLYVHLHGHVWSEEAENKYIEMNKGVADIPSIPPPTKEEINNDA